MDSRLFIALAWLVGLAARAGDASQHVSKHAGSASRMSDAPEHVERATRLRDRCWKWYVATDPLDAFTIGVREAGRHLPDISGAAWARQDEHAREVLAEIAELRIEALPQDLALSIEAIRRDALYTRHQFERRFYLWNIAWSDVPPTLLMLQAGAARSPEDWQALSDRLDAYPRLLTQHEANLLQGVAQGLHADWAEAHLVAERLLPSDALPILKSVIPSIAAQVGVAPELRAQVAQKCELAAQALERHQHFLVSRYLTSLPHEWTPDGEAEVGWRLQELQGLPVTPRELFDSSSTWVNLAKSEVIARANLVDAGVRTFAQALDVLKKASTQGPKTAADALDLYRRSEARMEAAARAAGLPLPPDYNVRVAAAPLGFGRVAPVSNIPASLLDPAGDPLFVVSVEDEFLAQHDATDAAVLSAHEGTPGHALMSGWWHYLLRNERCPIAWTHQHDLTNALSGSWQTMLPIEGWALVAEGLLAENYSPAEGLAAQAALLLRAIRVRIDVGLHAGYLDREQAARELAEGMGMDLDRARAAIAARYSRKAFMGQALTYFMGKREIESLRTDWRASHPGSSNNEFYAEFLKLPPLPPSAVRHWLVAR